MHICVRVHFQLKDVIKVAQLRKLAEFRKGTQWIGCSRYHIWKISSWNDQWNIIWNNWDFKNGKTNAYFLVMFPVSVNTTVWQVQRAKGKLMKQQFGAKNCVFFFKSFSSLLFSRRYMFVHWMSVSFTLCKCQ